MLKKYFTIILWNPILFKLNQVLNDIPNIIEKKEIIIPKKKLHDIIFDIYKLDTRCTHHIVLPRKIKKFQEYNENHYLIKFRIDNPTFNNNLCKEAIQLKEKIRKKYKSNVTNYIRDIIIHVADNYEQSNYIWENYGL